MTTSWRHFRFLPLYSLAIFVSACGGGSSSPTSPSPTATTPPATTTPAPTPNPAPTPTPAPSSSPLGFRVDGTSHAASSATASFANGILSVAGTDSSRNTTLSFAVTPTAAGTGTYTFGPTTAANAMILVGSPAQSWQGGVGIGSGTITITALTSTTATGTFSFALTPVAGTGASGTKTITDGTFNVTLTTAAPPPTTSSSSTMSVLVDGVPWTSSVSRRATMTNNILTITGQDTNLRVITLAIQTSAGLMVPPSAPPTTSLTFGPDLRGIVTMVLGAQNWDNAHAGGEGTFTITSISQTRVTGTFTVTLVNNPINTVAVPTARLTSGTFDMALERF